MSELYLLGNVAEISPSVFDITQEAFLFRHAKKALSARTCIELDGKDLWLWEFTDVMTTLMSKAGIQQDATVDEITNTLLCMEDIPLKCNGKSKYILKAFEI